MASLQDQFLKAGLVSQKKIKQTHQEKSKQRKDERRSGVAIVDEVQQAVQETQRANAERARELNAQRDAVARQSALMAQIAQLVQQNRQSKGNGDIPYNFTYANRIKRIFVSAEVQSHLIAGRLVIICQGESIELVPRIVADKIAERDASLLVQVNKTSTEVDADDPYADYKIPDDFTW